MLYLTKSLVKKEFRDFLRETKMEPRRCKSLDQARKCVSGLSQVIADLQTKHGFAPEKAYVLLSEYNRLQNEMIARASA